MCVALSDQAEGTRHVYILGSNGGLQRGQVGGLAGQLGLVVGKQRGALAECSLGVGVMCHIGMVFGVTVWPFFGGSAGTRTRSKHSLYARGIWRMCAQCSKLGKHLATHWHHSIGLAAINVMHNPFCQCLKYETLP